MFTQDGIFHADALQAKLNVGWPRNRGEVATWLQQVLASEPLAGMDARFLFELGMASTLAEGWKPGKDLLLAPVIDGFGWRHDRGRLAGFGRPGAIVAAVLDELDYFDSLPERIRTQQRQLIRQLRDDKRPKTSLLMKQMKAVTHLTRMYPHWMHVITNTQNIERWQAWANQIPNWRRWLAGRPRDTGKPPLSLAPRFDGVGVTAIVLCLGLLGFTALFDPSRSVSAPPAPGPRPVSWSASALPGLNSPPALHEGELMGGGRPAVDAWYLTPPSMVYPPVARRLVQTGRVVVAVVIDANGQAGDVKVDTSSGHTILDNAALAAVRSAKYAPALNGAGKPVAAAYRLPFNFELEDGQSALLQPPRTYGEAVQAAVVPYIILPGQIVGNPQAEVTLQLASDGRILHQRLTHASGEPLWDAAVMRALQRVAKLPADPSGVVPPTMVIAFRPKS